MISSGCVISCSGGHELIYWLIAQTTAVTARRVSEEEAQALCTHLAEGSGLGASA